MTHAIDTETILDKNCREGTVRRVYIPRLGRHADVKYCRRTIMWEEDGLRGEIDGVLVGVDMKTDQVVLYPPEATPTIKAWREAMIEKLGLTELAREQEQLREEMRELSEQLAEYERLGLLDEEGCLDEEKYDAYMASQDSRT